MAPMTANSAAHPSAPAPSAPALGLAESSDGTSIAYRVLGDPAARPLVLVHGWAQSSACWGPEVLAALARRFRVVAPDLRGHGYSDVAEAGYDAPEQWADDLEAVLDAAGVAPAAADPSAGAILLGWSYGGIVVSDYLASRGQDRVAGIVLCGAVTSISRSAGGAVGPAMMQVADGGFDEDPATAIAALQRFGSAMMRSGDGISRQRTFGLSMCTPPAVRQKLLNRRVDNDETLRALRLPALVIHGEHDGVVPPSTGRANAELIPGATYAGFADSAHAPFLEEPSRFVEELEAFATRV